MVFFIILSLFSTVWIWKSIEVKTKAKNLTLDKKHVFDAVSKLPTFKDHVLDNEIVEQQELELINDELSTKPILTKIVEIIPTLIILACFLVYAFCVTFIDSSQ